MNPHRSIFTLLTLFLAVSFAGCKVTSDDLDYWQRTVKGPGKIAAVMVTPRYEIDLRTHAAIALIEMERSDVDGSELLERAANQLKDEDPEGLSQIIAGMTPRLTELLTEVPEGHDPTYGAPPAQVRAKDAVFFLLPLIPESDTETKGRLVRALVSWYAEDLATRSLSGTYSLEQVIQNPNVGDAGVRQLIDGINFELPQRSLVQVGELVGNNGTDETKALAAARLIEVTDQMLGEEFGTWMGAQIREQLASQDREESDEYVAAVVLHNRYLYLTEGALPAMKHLADQAPVRDKLMEFATRELPADASEGEKQRNEGFRATALRALESNAVSSQLSQLLDLALGDEPLDVRDAAFDRVADVNDRAAIPRLWPLIESAETDSRTRWRAGELILSIGGPDVIGEFLRRLPSEDASYDAGELTGYATQLSQMTPPPTRAVMAQLSSPDWFKRVIAIRYVQRRGTEADITRLQSMTGDSAELQGENWGEQEDVGDVAESSIAAMRERLAETEGGEGSSDE